MAKDKVYSRKDDVESIIYTLSYLIKGKLPWDQDYFNHEEEKGIPDKGKDSEMDQILERKKEMDDTKIRDNLPSEMQSLFTYARKLEYEEEPDYSFLMDYFKNLRNQALVSEGFKFDCNDKIKIPSVAKKSDAEMGNSINPSIQYKSIMSAIKISGIDPNINTITMQQNKTINSVNFSMMSASKDSHHHFMMKNNFGESRK